MAVMKPLLAAIPLAFLLGAVACGKNEPVADDAENAAGLDGVHAALPRDVARRKRPQRLRHLAVRQKNQNHMVPGCRMRR